MVIHLEKSKDYYKVGTKDDITISNSFFTALNPQQGGSPQKALAFFDKNVELNESKSVENGKVIHAYAEKPQDFGVQEIAKPDGMLGDMADEFIRLSFAAANDPIHPSQTIAINDVIVSNLKTENGRSAEILEIKDAFKNLAMKLDMDESRTITLFRLARVNAEAYKSYGEAVLAKKFLEATPYINQGFSIDGKFTLTVADKEKIDKVIAALRANYLANRYFALSESFDTNIIFKEVDVYFHIISHKAKAKARLDNLYIDIVNKIIYLNDLKTTSKPLSLFQEAIEYWRYYRQLAFYLAALKSFMNELHSIILEKTGMDLNFNEFKVIPQIIAVETTGNFECCVFNLEDYMPKGKQECKDLTDRYIFHKLWGWNQSMEQAQGDGVIRLKPIV